MDSGCAIRGGKERVALRSGRAEAMGLSFLDATGQVRGDGMSLLEMSDQSGRTRTVVGVLAEGLAWVGLLDEQQRFRAGLGA